MVVTRRNSRIGQRNEYKMGVETYVKVTVDVSITQTHTHTHIYIRTQQRLE